MEHPNFNPTDAGNVGRKLRLLLAEGMKHSGKNRAEIAREMKEVHGCAVTEHMLNEFCRGLAGKRDSRFPAAWLPAIEEITGDTELLLYLMGPRLRELAELGQRVSDSQWALEKALAEARKLAPGYGQRKRKAK